MKIIWSSVGISRADLSRATGMSRSSISDIVSTLMEQGLVKEVGDGESKGGRKPRILKFNDNVHQILTLSIGRRSSQIGLMNLRASINNVEVLDYGLIHGPDAVLGRIKEDLAAYMKRHHLSDEKVLGMGISLPCPVKEESAPLLSAVLYPDWAQVNLLDEISTVTSCAIFFENDANLGALAENWWGARRDQDLIYVAVSEGYGAGIIIDRQIFRGRHGMAGEIGHMIIDSSSGQWHRGIQGSLASYIVEEALVRIYQEQAQLQGRDVGDDMNLESIAAALLQDDKAAMATIDHLCHYLAIALTNLVHILDIGTIVLGGTLARFGEIFFAKLRQKMAEHSLWSDTIKLSVEPCSVGQNQILVGAGTLVLDAFLGGRLGKPQIQSSATLH